MKNELKIIDKNEFKFVESGDYIIDFNKCNGSLIFVVSKNIKITISIFNIQPNITLDLFLNDNSQCTLKLISSENYKSIDLKQVVMTNALLSLYFIDFGNANSTFQNNSILFGNNSKCDISVSSLSNNENKKLYNICSDSIGKDTDSKIQFYGVALNKSYIEMKGFSHIEKDSFKSVANQNCKIILFDKESKGRGDPCLKIDCDDIKASHGCAIGSLNDEHIFYLLSRGLSLKEARKLITFGYFLPTINKFGESERVKVNKILEDTL